LTLNVGLFGAGRIGRVHARSIAENPRSRLAAVTDLVAQSAQDLADQYATVARSSDDILADNAIDAIVIASSTNTHVDLIEAGIAAGKAVFCEKPVDLDLVVRVMDDLWLRALYANTPLVTVTPPDVR